MPCVDYEAQEHRAEMERRNAVARAGLCGLINALVKRGDMQRVLAEVDWEDIGITPKELAAWWHQHQAEDAARRRREERKQEIRLQMDQATADALAQRGILPSVLNAKKESP